MYASASTDEGVTQGQTNTRSQTKYPGKPVPGGIRMGGGGVDVEGDLQLKLFRGGGVSSEGGMGRWGAGGDM